MVAWLLVPADGADSNIASQARTDRRGIALAAGLGSLLAVVLLIASALGAGWFGSAGLAAGHQRRRPGADLAERPPDERATMRRLAEPLLGLTGGSGRSRTVLRLAVAAVLLVVGLAALLSAHESLALLPAAGRGGAGDRRDRGGARPVVAAHRP